MLGVVFNDGKIGNLYIISAHGRRLKDWWPRDKASRKVAKKGQAGSRQSHFVQGRAGRRLSSYASLEVSVGRGSKKAVGGAGRELS